MDDTDMPSRQRLIYLGRSRGLNTATYFGEQVHEARLGLGMTLKELGRILDISASQLSRIERARPPYPDFVDASTIGKIVGLDVSVRCFPSGAPIRDLGHVRLIEKLLAESHPSINWELEKVLPIPGDLRAFDLVGSVEKVRIGVAAETRLRDVQALLRRENAKVRDAQLDRLLLLLAATHANRATLAAVREELRAQLPLDSRAVLAALRAGRDPGADGIVLL